MDQDRLLRAKLQRVKLLEEKLRLKEGLPYKHSFKRYGWQKRYSDNRDNKKRLVCAANQIGKSTIQICDRIDIATSPDLWPVLWPNMYKFGPKPKPFSWYLYPNQDTVWAEFYEKWVPTYLPRDEFKNHPVYGWKETVTNKVLKYITFNSGWRIYFKTYNQNVSDLQSGTVWAVDCDEELPEALLPELEARLFSTDGYFSMVFTATLGQDIWRRAIQPSCAEEEIFKDAFKQQISMYDCVEYADGTATPWTPSRIKRVEGNCKDKREIDRRVRGRFVLSAGLKYPSFSREVNYKPYPKTKDGKYFKGVPPGWHVYSSVDPGGGGEAHPAAYSFLSVSPDYTKIRWFRGRRMDGYETTAFDIYKAYKKDRGKVTPVTQAYDFGAKDFGTITGRAGESFKKANKDHAIGEMALNTALKTGMLVIYFDPEEEESESGKLVQEFESLLETTPKQKARDDLIDSVRYAIVEIPIDWETILDGKVEKPTPDEAKQGSPEKERPNDYWVREQDGKDHEDEYEEEFSFWNDQLE